MDEEAQGGGPLIDIGTHALDLTLWMMNNYEPESVMGSVYRKLADQTEQGNMFGEWDPTPPCASSSKKTPHVGTALLRTACAFA